MPQTRYLSLHSSANEKFVAAAGKVEDGRRGMRKEDFYDFCKVGDSGEWSITVGTGTGTDTLSGYTSVLEFEDGVLALDTDPGDTAGQAYRPYQEQLLR